MNNTPNPNDSHTPPSRPDSRRPHSRHEAEVQEILAALSGHRVQTLARIKELCWGEQWSDQTFERALQRAISSGKVRPLGNDTYELVEPPSPPTPP